MGRGWLAVTLLYSALGCGGESSSTPDATIGFVPPTPPICAVASSGGFCDASNSVGALRTDFLTPFDGPSGGAALADFDNDGDLDLFVTGANIDSVLYVNDGAGQFTRGSVSARLDNITDASGVGAADLDNDGDQDLVVTGINSRVRVYENDGTGVFSEVGAAAGFGTELIHSSSVAIGDYDLDGNLDVYVTRWIDSDDFQRQTKPNMLFHNLGGFRFEEVAEAAGVSGVKAWFALAAAFTDVDSDGWPDLYVGNDFGMWHEPNADMRNQRDGTFAAPEPSMGGDVAIFSMSVSPADYDNDGDLDIYITSHGDNVLLQNDGTGAWTDVATGAGVTSYGYTADDDEYGQYVVIDPQSQDLEEQQFKAWAERYLHPERASTHVSTGWAALWFDYDHDGWLDLYVCNGFVNNALIPEGRHQPNQLFHNEGDGTFTDQTYAMGVGDRGTAHGCALGDLDGDGDLDIVVVNAGYEDGEGGALTILRNNEGQGHYVRVHLVGSTSNRDGIGARVELRAGGATYVREVSGGDGMLSSSQRDVHFGLGTITEIEQISVRWPSGTMTRTSNPGIDQTIEIIEP